MTLSLESLRGLGVESAQFWLYHTGLDDNSSQSDGVLTMTEFSFHKRSKNVTERDVIAKDEALARDAAWRSYDLTRLVKRWSRHLAGNRTRGLKLEFGEHSLPVVTVGSRRPLLVVKTLPKDARRRRRKRQIGSSCRLMPFEVNFESMGWDSWVIQPLTYQANYCAGPCK